jgi:hypothetical protein
MIRLHALRNSFLESAAFGKLCRALGIDPHQYRLLLNLFATLSDRLEFLGATVGLNKIIGAYFALSVLISLGVLAHPPLPGFLLFMLGFSMFYVLIILLMDVSNSIMSPDEAPILAHQPIRGPTYTAAKLTYMLQVVALVISSLNLVPAVAGLYLRESHWFYPLTHMASAYLAGLFVAFLICGTYGWCFLLFSPAKLKNAALWLQFIPFVVTPALNSMWALPFSPAARILHSSWMPWRWFVAVGLIGQVKYAGFSVWEALAACVLTLTAIGLGLRGFKRDYLIKVTELIQGSAAPAKGPEKRLWLNPAVRKLTGAPSGFGAFSFAALMLRRDWNFRRQGLPFVGYFVIFLPLIIVKAIKISPFVRAGFSIRDFSPMHFLPHILGVILAIMCSLIAYTAEPKGPSMFVPLPMKCLRPFARGIYLSLWCPMGVLHLFLLVPCIWLWGIIPGVLFICFSLALVSFYLGVCLLLIDGLPFATAFKPSMGSALPLTLLFALIPIGLFAVIQWLVFHSAWLVLIGAVVLAALAFVAAHFSLGNLEKKIRENLNLLGLGPQQIFKEAE